MVAARDRAAKFPSALSVAYKRKASAGFRILDG